MISKNIDLIICDTFQAFNMFIESMMYYIETNKTVRIDGILTRFDEDTSFRERRILLLVLERDIRQ